MGGESRPFLLCGSHVAPEVHWQIPASWSRKWSCRHLLTGRTAMRVRPDSVFISSILHTIALLFFVHPSLWYYGAPSDPAAVARYDAEVQQQFYAYHAFGVASLVIILIGLIVVWTGYAGALARRGSSCLSSYGSGCFPFSFVPPRWSVGTSRLHFLSFSTTRSRGRDMPRK